MHIAFRKSLATGIVSITSSGNWDGLKRQLSELDYHDTEDWDRHFSWENFRDGRLIKDSTSIWRYINFDPDENFENDGEYSNLTVFEGELVDLQEVDPIFD